MPEVPSGTVTFLFTDIEGSTRLWETDATVMRDALARHDEILRDVIAEHRGHVFATGGDGFAVAFRSAADALAAAAAAQQRVQADGLPPVRMGLHTGEAVERGADYFGPSVNRTARLMGIAHGGQILVSQATERLASGAGLRDLGEHRLRDLLRPERVFELTVPGDERDFGPLASLDALPTNLPVQLTTFVGRVDESKHLARLLDEHRLVTITGVGGVGKTRLAIQVAAERVDDFDDGVWLAELAQAEAEDTLVDVVAVALRAPSRPNVSMLESIVEFLQARQVLLVVDNCEHLLNAASGLVERVLQHCPRVRVLATSREGLGIPGEQLWPLRSLSTPSADDAASDAVDLFVDRASSVVPDFALDSSSAIAVADICRRLDGIPLAIELAAARVAVMGPGDIAAHLDERFRLLTGGRRRAVERHQTLRAAVDWSYQMLGDRERLVFDRLGVFVGSFDSSAAQGIAGGDAVDAFEVIDALGELVAKSMVNVERLDGRSRYQLLETLRQYALEQLDARGETDALRLAHAQYYARVAAETGPRLLGPDEIAARLQLMADLDNLRAAVGWAVDAPDEDGRDLGVRIVGAIARETVLNRTAGVGAWAERTIVAAASADARSWWLATTAAAYGLFHRGDLDGAEMLASRAAAESRATDPDTAVWAAMCVSNVTAQRGLLDATVTMLDDIVTWMPEESVYDSRIIRSILALYLKVGGHDDRAEDLARGALEQARVGGQPSSLALALYAYAMTVVDRDPVGAEREARASIALTEQGASDVVFANAHGLLAHVAERQGDVDSAIRLVQRAIEYADMVGDRPPMIDSIFTTARLLADREAWEPFITIAAAIKLGWYAPMAQIVREIDDISPALLARAATAIGAAAADAARARGAAMSYDEIVALSLRELRALV